MQHPSFMILMCLAFSGAIRADEPPTPAPTTVAAATEPASTVSAEKTPAQLKKEAAEATIRRYGVNGYKPETKKSGDVVYCRMEAPVGSRFEVKQCRTFQQLRDEALKGKEFTEQLQHDSLAR